MPQYIALLRGINVGGKNKVPMQQLQTVFEQAGFEEVRTYINSGNVLFASAQTDTLQVQQLCQQILHAQFPFSVPVCVIQASSLLQAVDSAPTWWDAHADWTHRAIFAIAPMTAEEVVRLVGQAKAQFEKVFICGQVIFWSAPLCTFSRTQWSKVSTTAAYEHITMRNANTTKKLVALAQTHFTTNTLHA